MDRAFNLKLCGIMVDQLRIIAAASLMLFGLSFMALSGCSDDDRPKKILIYVPPRPVVDMGADDGPPAPDMMSVPSVCAGLAQGSFCELPQATGVCVAGQCQLVACLSGFKDCDQQLNNGCEADVTTQERCGQCDQGCREQESCQLGAMGYACGVGVLCTRGRYDVNLSVDDGCEWVLGADEISSIQPAGAWRVERGALTSDKTSMALAGADDTSRLVAHSIAPLSAPAVALPEPLRGALEVSASPPSTDAMMSVAVWPDGVAFNRQDKDMLTQQSLPSPCLGPVELVGFVGGQMSAQATVFAQPRGLLFAPAVSRCVEAPSCFEEVRRFSEADYLRAFWPYAPDAQALLAPDVAEAPWRFSAQEVAQCQPCLWDLESGLWRGQQACWSTAVCALDPQELSACEAGCDAQSAGRCPRLEPSQVLWLDAEERIILAVTQRGALALRYEGPLGWSPKLRLEQRFDPDEGMALSGGFVRAAVQRLDAGRWRVALLHQRAFLRVFEVDSTMSPWRITPMGPDVGLELVDGIAAARVALGPNDTALVSSGLRVLLVSLRWPGVRQQLVRLEEGVVDYKILDIIADSSGYTLLRDSLGLIERVTLRLDPQEMSAPAAQ